MSLASRPATSQPLPLLRDIRSFHIGGRVASLQNLAVEMHRFACNGTPRPVNPNGEQITGQMYVQAFLQDKPRHPVPVLFWHGGGMTGVNWETTPDDRAGWLHFFLHAGYDVYICDAVERGRAGWSRWPEIYAGPPVHRTLEDAWDMFRFGPPGSYHANQQQRVPHTGLQFSMAHFEQFAAQFVPRWDCNDEVTLATYDALLKRVGKCIVIGHSQGGGFAMEAARRRPDGVEAVVVIEPSGAPNSESTGTPPHLVVWGDNMEEATQVWQGYRSKVERYFENLSSAGVKADTCDLPVMGIRGNTHFPMLDLNSDKVAHQITTWLDALQLSTCSKG